MYYPIFAEISGKNCVVIGGGKEAERKVRSLLECGAKVTIINPKLTPTLLDLSDHGRLIHAARDYRLGDLKGTFMVLCMSSPEVNTKVAKEANRRGILVSVAGEPKQSNFILPSVVRRGELVVAVSTGGNSPALTEKIRQDLQKVYGPEYREYVELLADVERRAKEKYGDPKQRFQALSRVMDSDILELLKKGRRDLIKGRIKQCI